MAEASTVPSLENLAFEMCYNEILGNLILCPEHRPPGKRLPWLSFSHVISSTPFFSSQKARALVRQKLDHYLVGTMSDKIRGKFVNKFYTSLNRQSQLDAASKNNDSTSEDSEDEARNEPVEEECIVDIWAFLDCVLDDTFLELKTHAAFPGTKSSLKLMSTIAEKSPNLQKLAIDFQLVKSKGGAVKEDLKSIVLSLSSLQHLTSLHLTHLNEKLLRPSALSQLGSSCPGLSHLSIKYNCYVHKKEVLALIVGQLYDDLLPDSSEEPDWFKNSALDRLIVPSELLSPLCFTILELDLSLYDYHEDVNAAFVAAFALRHFRNLQTMDDPVPTGLAIKILHDADKSSIQNQFGKACLIAAERQASPSLLALQRNLNATFPGFLTLTKLESINVLSRDLLKAIGSLCPSLKEVHFIKDKRVYDRHSKQVLEPHERITSLMELECILNQWPKVTTILIDGQVPPDYIQTILKVFGAEVLDLEFQFGSKFYVKDLTSANRLENLSISSYCELLGSTEDPILCADNFLPRLKFLESSSCLGVWSYLFEEKPSLVRLVLKCCHIGIETSNEGSNARPLKRFKPIKNEANIKQLGWTRIPEMWQLLEKLNVEKCVGLTMPMVSNLVSKLPKLKTIYLPHQVRSTDLHLSYRVTEELSNRIPSVELSFYSEEDADDDCSLVL